MAFIIVNSESDYLTGAPDRTTWPIFGSVWFDKLGNGDAGVGAIVDIRHDTPTPNRGFQVTYEGATNIASYRVQGALGVAVIAQANAPTFGGGEKNGFMHFAFVSRAEDDHQFWVNGCSAGVSSTAAGVQPALTVIDIGRRRVSPALAFHVHGCVARFGLWSVDQTANVNGLYSGSKPGVFPTGLVTEQELFDTLNVPGVGSTWTNNGATADDTKQPPDPATMTALGFFDWMAMTASLHTREAVVAGAATPDTLLMGRGFARGLRRGMGRGI